MLNWALVPFILHTQTQSGDNMHLYNSKLFFVWRLFGLAPARVQGSKISVSKLFIVYNIFLMGLLTLFSCYPIYVELNSSIRVRMTSVTARVGCIMDHLSLLFSCLAGIVFNAVYCSGVIKLMNEVQSVDKMLDFKMSEGSFLTYSCLYLLAFLIIVIADLINWHFMVPESIVYAPSYFLHIIAFGAQFGYVDIVLQIKKRFLCLNSILTETLINETFDNSNVSAKCIRVYRRLVSDGGIIGFTHVHWLLCDVIRQVNHCFGYQVLLMMLSILIHIIITPYFFLLGIAYPSHNADRNGFYLVTQAMWTCIHALQLVIITWSCSTSTDKANETGPLMSKCLLANIGEDSQKEMEASVVQLLHHKAAFSACGLFDINLPIITAVTGAVTTYLVILIQFQNADTGDD